MALSLQSNVKLFQCIDFSTKYQGKCRPESWVNRFYWFLKLLWVFSLLISLYSTITSPQLYQSFARTAGPSRRNLLSETFVCVTRSSSCCHVCLHCWDHLSFACITVAGARSSPRDGVKLSLHLFLALKMFLEILEGLQRMEEKRVRVNKSRKTQHTL